MRILFLILLFALLLETGCASCAPLGPRELPTGEDKYSAQYD